MCFQSLQTKTTTIIRMQGNDTPINEIATTFSPKPTPITDFQFFYPAYDLLEIFIGIWKWKGNKEGGQNRSNRNQLQKR